MEKVIELEKEIVSFKRRAFIWFLELVAVVLFLLVVGEAFARVKQYAVTQYDRAYTWALEQVTRTEIIREYVHVEEATTEALVQSIARKMGMNPIIVEALIEQESAKRHDAIRFEEHVYRRISLEAPGLPDDQRRMLASSHGLMQVMGHNARRMCSMSWADLYDRRKNIECGVTILKKNLTAHKTVKEPGARLRLALRDYNGRGERAEAYADRVMGRIADMLLVNLGEGL